MTNDDVSCPVCGYYCLGKGGIGCIDKPKLCGIVPKESEMFDDEMIKTLMWIYAFAGAAVVIGIYEAACWIIGHISINLI